MNKPSSSYCCPMRARFLVAIVGVDQRSPEPLELADYVLQWSPSIIVGIRFCPFCGTVIDGSQQRRVAVGPQDIA